MACLGRDHPAPVNNIDASSGGIRRYGRPSVRQLSVENEGVTMKAAVVFLVALSIGRLASAQPSYDLLIKGGHVIDGRNGIDAVRDVAIKAGRIAAVAADIPSAQATKTVDAAGLYVTPGLVDIHVHGYHGEKGTAYAGGPLGVPIDAFSLRSCVTTVADAGSSGWRNFDDFKARIIDTSKTRVTAFLNIVGYGMGGGKFEQNLADMEVKPTADMALKHKGVIVGVKSAHFNGAEWTPYERAVEAGTIANIPVMVDFGSARVRTIKELFERVFRPGDIYTHAYAGGGRGELIDGKVNPAIFAAQKKGIIFDIGHGGGSFVWQTAVQAFKEGYYPDSLSSDLHVSSMNAGMKDMTNIMSKFLALGMPLKDVVVRSTWNPAKEIKLEQLGNLSVGAPADIAVLRLEKGKFGFLDQRGGRLDGTQRLGCELTLRDGAVVYDLNGLASEAWEKMAPK
jgi:dihydroorotase